ncbi:hypothetical protein REJ26_001892 [Providencia stuartii]|uniref:Uncharacterized protein n=1 Tax=Providencia stuartii TaxID=588 RepID=A0AAI9DD87_PROST|nr:hypothetical protein [Providencia sp. 2023EL-00965]ELR5113459.1 hypothetical protein [Providencia stuartii]ELR5300128.1 hypothetical protein [Providencia stuartii]MDW7589205.1 hypothetical protein [Providencia sp. 2023EL-00965]
MKFSISNFKNKETGEKLDHFGYVHIIYNHTNIPEDLIFSMIEIISPTFKVVDNMLFIDNLFSQRKYDEHLSSGISKEKTQFWLNLVDISSVFDILEYEETIIVAEKLVHCWNLKIKGENLQAFGQARILRDDSETEVLITVDQYSHD